MRTKHFLLVVLVGGRLAAPSEAFVQPGRFVCARKQSHCSSSLQRKFMSLRPAVYKSALFTQEIERNDNVTLSIRRLGPSAFFFGLAAMLAKLLIFMQQSSLSITSMGTVFLFCVTAAVCYDNLIIGFGNMFTDSRKTLKWLSYPRFLLHFVGVPFLYTTTAEIGQAAGVPWLRGDCIHSAIVTIATVIAAASTRRFFHSPGIALADTSDYPPQSLVRQLTWYTYAKQDFLYYVFPSVLLAFWSIVVGVSALRHTPSAGIWLIASAAGVLVGSAQKKNVARFTGNLVEVTMLWCMFMSASLVL